MTKLLYLKLKLNEEKKKKKGKKKRSEENQVMTGIEFGTFDAPGQSFTTRPRGTNKYIDRNFIIKTFESY